MKICVERRGGGEESQYEIKAVVSHAGWSPPLSSIQTGAGYLHI